MERREFIKSGAAAVALGSLAAAPEKRPNVLMILVDQMRYPRWTLPGITPNIDRLLASGVNFSSHFAAAVPCSPSRACLFTGTYSFQNNMLSNCDFVEGKLQPSLNPGIPTLGHLFRDAGYRTPYRGKWHLTRKADRDPEDALIQYGFEGWKPPEAPFGGPPYNGALMDPVYAQRAIKWLAEDGNSEQPWFLTASFINPHDICSYPRFYPHTKLNKIRHPEPPPNYTDDLSTKPAAQAEHRDRWASISGKIDSNDPDAWRRYLDYYAHCLSDVDQNVGKVLAALDETGLRDNTIVVFTTDHGEMAGSHQLRTKGNFAYEEEINIPFGISWPGRIPAGRVSDAMCSNIDLMPTLAELAGIRADNYQAGVSLVPALTDPESAEIRDHVQFRSSWQPQVAVGKQPGVSSFKNPSNVRCLRERRWKYAHYSSTTSKGFDQELYDLENDPLEMVNLARDPAYSSRMSEMHDRLMAEEKALIEDCKY